MIRQKYGLHILRYMDIFKIIHVHKLNACNYTFPYFSEKTRLDVSSESSARQRIHMKIQALFSSKDKVKN